VKRLTALDWETAALHAIAEGGLAAVSQSSAVRRLTARAMTLGYGSV
jgi:hypothetical protein